MKMKMILSALVAATMLGASITPVLADGDKSRGKKKGHYKNGKAYGQHHSQKRKSSWDKNRRSSWDDNKRRSNWEDSRRRSDWEAERRRRAWEDEQRRRREADRWRAIQSNQRYRSNSDLDRLSNRRQQTKNEWRNLAILSGAVSVLGLVQKDNRLVFAGAAGALYSLHRYEQDRKSQSKVDRLRASYFSQPYFVREGRRYDRRMVTKSGQRYYQFVRR